MQRGFHPRTGFAVRHAIARHMDVDCSEVWPVHDLREDLGLDAFDLTLIVLRLEDELDLEVPPGTVDSATTVADLESAITRVVTAHGCDDASPRFLPIPMARRSSDLEHRRISR